MTAQADSPESRGGPRDETLAQIDALSGLDHGALADLARRCQWRRYSAGQPVVFHNEENRDVFFIVSGRVRVTLYSVSGKEVTFRDQGAGEMFGELAAIDGQPRSAYVVALSDALIASMPDTAFWQAIHDQPAFAEATLRRLTKLIRALSERVFEFSTLAVKNRIHAELLRLGRVGPADSNTAVIDPAPTHADIASRVSTHREAVTRELNRLAQAGIVARKSGKLVICDMAQLERMVHEVLGD